MHSIGVAAVVLLAAYEYLARQLKIGAHFNRLFRL